MTTRRDLLKMAGLAGAVALAPKDASMPEEEPVTFPAKFGSAAVDPPMVYGATEPVAYRIVYCSTGEFADDSPHPGPIITVSDAGPRYKSGWKRPKRDA